MTYGSKSVVFFELDQPFCSLVWGETTAAGTCPAKLGVDAVRKCFQTFATCPVQQSFTPGTLTLRFTRDDDRLPLEYGPLIACLDSVDTTPGRINLAGMEDESAAFGKREAISVRLRDFLWSDHLVDKYRLERTFVEGQRLAGYAQPAQAFPTFGTRARARPELEVAVGDFLGYDDPALLPYNRGTFWSRWVARNPHYATMSCRVREGYAGQALEDMRVRHYVVERVVGPVNGEVSIIAKDVFARIESRKALAPHPSIGELSADLTGTPGTFDVTPTGVGSFTPALGGYSTITGVVQGYVAIGQKEIVKVTRSGDTFTVVQRGALGTTQSDHDEGDSVQLVLAIEAQLGHDLAYQLITGYSTVEPSRINKPELDALAADLTELFTGYIAEPTPINELLGDIMVASGFTLWPDVSSGMIKYTPLRSGGVSPRVTDRAWILEGTFDHQRRDDKRISQAIVHFVKRSALSRVDDKQSYAARVVTPGPGSNPYGTESVRHVFTRFIQTGGRVTAQKCGERIYAMYRDPPVEARFQQDAAKAGQLVEAKYFELETAEIQDDVGVPRPITMAPLSIKRGENLEEIEAMSVRFSASSEDGVRRVFIDTDEFDVNLRTLHDSQFAPPTGSEVIEFIVAAPVLIGSSFAPSPAMRTGSWPAMSTPPKIIVLGRVQGAGGKGADGFPGTGAVGCVPSQPGQDGGTALLVEAPFSVDNTSGKIWGGGGGGPSGAATNGINACGNVVACGGGGGAGSVPGEGGFSTDRPPCYSVDSHGQAGSLDAGGSGGVDAPPNFNSANAGAGGGPGLPGVAAGTYSGCGGMPSAAPGAAGKYVDGNDLVTWIATGDVRGTLS